MSSAMENRAAVFTSQPQVVEIYRSGGWSPGELLGWRHDDSGACQVWVRFRFRGVEETTWMDLAALRLPEPALEAAPEPSRAGRGEPARRAEPSRSGLPVAVETTVSLPMARDRAAATPSRSGGRRRAPEVIEVAEVTRGRVARPATPAPMPAPGRHRARSVDPVAGRDRADTNLIPVVADGPPAAASPVGRSGQEHPVTDAWAVPATGSAPEGRAGAGSPWGAQGDELLTRPMRLTDALPHARRPRLVAH